MKADECVGDMAGATQVENQPRGCIEDNGNGALIGLPAYLIRVV